MATLGLEGALAFAADAVPVTDADLPGLYALADAVFLPSRQEGFGLPAVESALLRVPCFCIDREPMASLLSGVSTLFGGDTPPDEIAARLIGSLQADPAFHARKAARDRYGWEKIYAEGLAPLLEGESPEGRRILKDFGRIRDFP